MMIGAAQCTMYSAYAWYDGIICSIFARSYTHTMYRIIGVIHDTFHILLIISPTHPSVHAHNMLYHTQSQRSIFEYHFRFHLYDIFSGNETFPCYLYEQQQN